MLFSIIIYTTTFFIMFLLALCQKENKVLIINTNRIAIRWDLLMALLFTVVFGLRYNVGIDYATYLSIYKFQYIERFEFLFEYITELLYDLGFHVVFFFSLWVFGQIYFLLRSFRDEKYIYPSLVFILFAGQYFLMWMNVIRQDLAACIFIFSIIFIVKKDVVKYLLCIILASGLHYSAIYLLLFYPLFYFKKNIFNNIYIQFILLALSIYISVESNIVIQVFEKYFDRIIEFGNIEGYTLAGVEERFKDVILGFSFFSGIVINLLIIIYSRKMKEYYNTDKFLYIYDLYFGGQCLNYIFSQSYILMRPVRYFLFFKMIVSAYLLFYLYKNRNVGYNMFAFITLIICYFILYAAIFRSNEAACYYYDYFKF